jgi:hypothetical protein
MSYLFGAILLVFVLACLMLAEMFWSWSSLFGEKSLSNSLNISVAAGGVFAIYAGIDYVVLDYLMLVPGTSYVIA